VTEPIGGSEHAHPGASPEPVVHVVVAGADAPDPLLYLLEAEGFSVVGCATDEMELAIVLALGMVPDVVVLDADISAASVMAARERAPAAHIIVLWPDGVQSLPDTERIAPWLVYEQLGPAIRRATYQHPQPHEVPDPVIGRRPAEPVAPIEPEEPVKPAADASRGRAVSRTLVAPALVAALMFTMGAAFALGGLHVRLPWAAPRTDVPAKHLSGPASIAPTGSLAADRPTHDRSTRTTGPCRPAADGVRKGANSHESTHGAPAHARTCPATGGPSGPPTHPGKDDHPGQKPDGAGAGSSHGSGGQPDGEAPHPSRSPSTPPDTEHRPG